MTEAVAGSDDLSVSVAIQMSPLRQFNGATFNGDLFEYAQDMLAYLVDNLGYFTDPRGADLFIALTAQRGDETAGHEYRSGHYVKVDEPEA